ncbi:MAG: hypothetical protein FD167_4797, partial [bacterium]
LSILNQPIGEPKRLEFWDGCAAERIIDAIVSA